MRRLWATGGLPQRRFGCSPRGTTKVTSAQWQEAFERALADSAYLRAQNEQLSAEVTRVERLEAIVVLLCREAMRGQGMLGKPFQDFIDHHWQVQQHDA